MSQQAIIFQEVSFKLYGFTMHPFIPFFQTTPCEEGRSPVQILGVALLLCILACVPRSMLVFEPRFGPKHPKTTTHVAQGGDFDVYILLYNAWPKSPVNRFVPTEVGY